MDKRLFWRAALTQAAVVAVVFAVLLVLLGRDFFDDNGIIVGPVAWIACAGVTALVLKLPWQLAVFAAAAGGVAGGLVFAAGAPQEIGIVVAIAVFGACCGGYETAQRELAAADADRKRDGEQQPDGDRTTAR
jgi:hypothetical protein